MSTTVYENEIQCTLYVSIILNYILAGIGSHCKLWSTSEMGRSVCTCASLAVDCTHIKLIVIMCNIRHCMQIVITKYKSTYKLVIISNMCLRVMYVHVTT